MNIVAGIHKVFIGKNGEPIMDITQNVTFYNCRHTSQDCNSCMLDIYPKCGWCDGSCEICESAKCFDIVDCINICNYTNE